MAEFPNLFSLQGDGISVTLTLGAFDGRDHLAYQDSTRAEDFSGDRLVIEDTGLGRIATVTLVAVPDLGTTTFTLLVPAVNLRGARERAVTTYGVTTISRTTIAGPGPGQNTHYKATTLTGCAEHVESLVGGAAQG